MKTKREIYRDVIIAVVIVVICYCLGALVIVDIIKDPNWLRLP